MLKADARVSPDLGPVSTAPCLSKPELLRLTRSFSTHWENLAVVTFSAPPGELVPFLPRGTELDLFHGEAKVSLVGFQFRRTSMFAVPSPAAFDFSEVNLRTYVRDSDGVPGVVFLRELCPSRIACILARFLFNERFERCDTSFHRSEADSGLKLGYAWGNPSSGGRIELRSNQGFARPHPASEEFFTSERFFGFGTKRDGSTLRFEVVHPPWRVASAGSATVGLSGDGFLPPGFAKLLRSHPSSAFIMDGSQVDVFKHR